MIQQALSAVAKHVDHPSQFRVSVRPFDWSDERFMVLFDFGTIATPQDFIDGMAKMFPQKKSKKVE